MENLTDEIKNLDKQRFYEERLEVRLLASKVALRKNQAVEFYAGKGGMTRVLLRRISKVITNDIDPKANCDYQMDAVEFAEKILPKLGQVDCLDFDAYGNPNLAIQKAFETIDKSSLPFSLCYTDGLGLGMKFSSKVDLKKFYLCDDDVKEAWKHLKGLSYNFIMKLAEKHNWKATCKLLLRSRNRNFVFGAWLIEEK